MVRKTCRFSSLASQTPARLRVTRAESLPDLQPLPTALRTAASRRSCYGPLLCQTIAVITPWTRGKPLPSVAQESPSLFVPYTSPLVVAK